MLAIAELKAWVLHNRATQQTEASLYTVTRFPVFN